MTKKVRRQVSEEEKVKALKRHLLEKVPVSAICEELGIAPSLFYNWQNRLFESAAQAMARSRGNGRVQPKASEQKRIEQLEARLRKREEALAELMTEHVALKKRSIGEV